MMFSTLLLISAFLQIASSQPQTTTTTTNGTIILPPQVVSPPPPPPQPLLPAIPPNLTNIPAPTPECPALDQLIKEKYDAFFILTRLVDMYTLQNEPTGGPPLNQSYAPLTILAPTTSSVVAFLMENKLSIQDLASNPLQAVLLAPTLGSHFVRGFYPAPSLPTFPVDTLCGTYCGNITFSPKQPVQVIQQNPQNLPFPVNTTIITPNVAVCPDQWVIHEVDSVLSNPTTEKPLNAAAPALDIAYALNGGWNTYNVAG